MRTTPLTPAVAELVAALTLLRDRLAPVVDELLAGEASQAGLDELAVQFELIAADLRGAGADTPRVVDADQVLVSDGDLEVRVLPKRRASPSPKR